ncbi:unnamed protein product [Arctia plantaginis]|uniref:Uncharacterized protein n=1 Tax=Arctia plantaginis TaxID=874455 RepID=A0A8S1BQM6_ARCPL|nr:unnamed protein product [Arctia plantaginis]
MNDRFGLVFPVQLRHFQSANSHTAMGQYLRYQHHGITTNEYDAKTMAIVPWSITNTKIKMNTVKEKKHNTTEDIPGEAGKSPK